MTVAQPPMPCTALTVAQRHRARRLAYANGGLWAFGNGLVSGMLIIYLALELGGPRIGLGVSLLLAAPQLAGLLRLAAPALLDRLVDRKRFCLGTYRLSALMLFGLPLVTSRWVFASQGVALTVLVILWCLYHLLEYLGTIALWSWLADLAHARVRGRFLGYRERWMASGQVMAMFLAGWFVWKWKQSLPESYAWIGYAILAVLGGSLLLAALAPLALIPGLANQRPAARPWEWRTLWAPFGDRRFLRLIAFGCWFSFFNGVTQAAQNIYPAKVLRFDLWMMHTLKIGMRGGQLLVSPALGRAADRHGNRAVLLATLPLVAVGLLFYAVATPAQPWWLIGAWVLWIAYAGVNVALPNLMLQLAPRESNAGHIAAYQAITGLCLAISTIVGGMLHDAWVGHSLELGGGLRLEYYAGIFLFGWLSRTAGMVLLLEIPENRSDDQ